MTVHYYSPTDFTHQGASWAGRRDKVGVEWKDTEEEKSAIERDFASAQAWAHEHNSPIFLGEFEVYDQAPVDSRVRYLEYVTRTAERLGWSWAYWQFDSDFILSDIGTDILPISMMLQFIRWPKWFKKECCYRRPFPNRVDPMIGRHSPVLILLAADACVPCAQPACVFRPPLSAQWNGCCPAVPS